MYISNMNLKTTQEMTSTYGSSEAFPIIVTIFLHSYGACMHTYIHAYKCVCVQFFVYCIYTCMYSYIYLYAYIVYIHICVGKYIYTQIHIYTNTHTHIYIHTYIHTYMLACVHACIYEQEQKHVKKYKTKATVQNLEQILCTCLTARYRRDETSNVDRSENWNVN